MGRREYVLKSLKLKNIIIRKMRNITMSFYTCCFTLIFTMHISFYSLTILGCRFHFQLPGNKFNLFYN